MYIKDINYVKMNERYNYITETCIYYFDIVYNNKLIVLQEKNTPILSKCLKVLRSIISCPIYNSPFH